MNRPLRRFLFQLLAVWILLCGIAAYLSHTKNIALSQIALIAPAFLIEGSFYLLLGNEKVRELLINRCPPTRLAGGLWLTALLPFLTYCLLTSTLSLTSLAWVVGMSTMICFWFVLIPNSTASDLLFLLLVATLLIYRAASHVYTPLVQGIDVNALGRITYVRTAILAVLLLRRLQGVHASFAPNGREWKVGFVHYLLFMPVGVLLFYFLPLGQFRVLSPDWLRLSLIGMGYFLAFLWGIGFWEEFFCRGYLQQVLGRGLSNEIAGWVLASLFFGLAHLWFRGFPNWYWVILATILGLFCGHAYRSTRSIRSAMVTHALVATTWRLFFA